MFFCWFSVCYVDVVAAGPSTRHLHCQLAQERRAVMIVSIDLELERVCNTSSGCAEKCLENGEHAAAPGLLPTVGGWRPPLTIHL